MRFPTLGQIGRNLAADTIKFAADNGGFWDQITSFALKNGLIPATPAGRLALFTAISSLGATVQANADEQKLLGKVFVELSSDAASEIGRRIAEQLRKG